MRMSLFASLQLIIERMVQCFPWYIQYVNPQQSSSETSLTELPLMTASRLEEHYYTPDNRLASLTGLNAYKTSGTSSKLRKLIYYSDSDEQAYMRIKVDVFRAIVGSYGYRRAMADMGTGHAEATALEVFRTLGMEVESISSSLPVEQHLERLSSFKPEVLYTMPSILERILWESDDPKAYGIRHLILVGEIASPSWIRQIAERLGINEEQITDTYGSIEIGTIAYFSHEHGRYLLTEGLYAEGLRTEELEEGLEPLADKDERVLVLTSAVRDTFPALRYVTYDVVRDLRPILIDGSLRQSFHSLVKRIGPDLKHGEKISLYDIEDVVYSQLAEASIRVKVVGNALLVYVYSPLATPSILQSIRMELEGRIPAIGMMIQARILQGIEVIGTEFEDAVERSFIKNKRISYE